jgi:C-terminal peptidase prc
MRDHRFRLFSAPLFFGVLIWLVAGPISRGANAPTPAQQHPPSSQKVDRRAQFARRVFTLTDLVLAQHIDPPARQQMIAEGLKAVFRAAKRVPPADLGARASEVRSSEDLIALLVGVWPQFPKATGPSRQTADTYLEGEFIAGMLQAVPGGAHLIPAKEARVESQVAANRYVGIGIALGMNDKSKMPVIMKALPGGTAAQAGIKAGDMIEVIDQKPVLPGTGLVNVVDRLRGEEGSRVELRIRREGSKALFSFTLLRLPVKFVTVDQVGERIGRPKRAWPQIGHLEFRSISASTAQELAVWERKFRAAGINAVILDLRNVGGYSKSDLHSAVLLADSLLDDRLLGKLYTRDGVREQKADRDCLFRDWPLVVLVNKRTSGAAEWVAAALQDAAPPNQHRNRRAIIVGSPSEGVNFVADWVPVPDTDQVLMVPTGLWERPNPGAAEDQEGPTPFHRPPDEPGHVAKEIRALFDQDAVQQAGPAPFHPWRIVPDVVVEDPTAEPVEERVAGMRRAAKSVAAKSVAKAKPASPADASYKVKVAEQGKSAGKAEAPDRMLVIAIQQISDQWDAPAQRKK